MSREGEAKQQSHILANGKAYPSFARMGPQTAFIFWTSGSPRSLSQPCATCAESLRCVPYLPAPSGACFVALQGTGEITAEGEIAEVEKRGPGPMLNNTEVGERRPVTYVHRMRRGLDPLLSLGPHREAKPAVNVL